MYQARFLVLMMGLFAVYAGFVYNEFFSLPVLLSSSCYRERAGTEGWVRAEGCVYPFGLDWVWF